MCPLPSYDNDGWKKYPQNLDLTPLNFAASRKNVRLSQLSKDLFVADNESIFECMVIGKQNKDGGHDVVVEHVRTTESLNRIMEPDSITSVVFLDQSYTWSRLCISEEHFRRVFTQMAVHPDFLDVVHLFCEKTSPVEEGFSSLFIHKSVRDLGNDTSRSDQDCGYDIGYNIKYAAKHGRPRPTDPFSIREVGVYQHFSSSHQRCRWVFLQAPSQLKDHLKRDFESCDKYPPAKQFLEHSMVLLDVSEGWREYLVYLEEEFTRIVDRGFFTNVKEVHADGDLQADFSDLRKLHILTDKLLRLAHILKMNVRLGHQLGSGMSGLKMISAPALQISFDEMQAMLDRYVYGQETSLARVETLIARSAGIGQLVQGIQDFRINEASKKINHEMQMLTEQGINENRLMKQLTEQSTRDTRSMMAIALLSAIFLPATFVATLFGSNFFVYSERDNALTVASNFWIYVIVTSVFSGGAIFLWFFWRRHRAHKRASDLVDD